MFAQRRLLRRSQTTLAPRNDRASVIARPVVWAEAIPDPTEEVASSLAMTGFAPTLGPGRLRVVSFGDLWYNAARASFPASQWGRGSALCNFIPKWGELV